MCLGKLLTHGHQLGQHQLAWATPVQENGARMVWDLRGTAKRPYVRAACKLDHHKVVLIHTGDQVIKLCCCDFVQVIFGAPNLQHLPLGNWCTHCVCGTIVAKSYDKLNVQTSTQHTFCGR